MLWNQVVPNHARDTDFQGGSCRDGRYNRKGFLAGHVRICDLVVTAQPVGSPRLNYMPKSDVAIAEIKALEDRRYSAMLAGDMAVLDELCSDDLIYTHSKADHDDKRSYLHKSAPATLPTSRSRTRQTAFWLSMAPRS